MISIRTQNDNGAVEVGTKFTQEMRQVDINNFREGDTFTIPENYTVYKQVVNGYDAFYILVDVQGTEKRFYPSVFWKNVEVVGEDKVPTGKYVHTTGQVAEDFRKYPTVEEGMSALKGRTIKYAKMNPVRTFRFGTIDLRTQFVPVIEYAD